MKKFKWILILLLATSCRSQEVSKPLPIAVIENPKPSEECNCLPHISIDTTTHIIREQKKEIHLLRVEIDDLKRKLENIRKLQELDSIIKTRDE